MRELVISSEGELKRNAKCLDRHDGDRTDSRANRYIDQRVALAVGGRNFVDHDHSEDSHDNRIE